MLVSLVFQVCWGHIQVWGAWLPRTYHVWRVISDLLLLASSEVLLLTKFDVGVNVPVVVFLVHKLDS